MPDNISKNTFIAAHLAEGICSASLKTTDFKAETLQTLAVDAEKIYTTIFNWLEALEREKKL